MSENLGDMAKIAALTLVGVGAVLNACIWFTFSMHPESEAAQIWQPTIQKSQFCLLWAAILMKFLIHTPPANEAQE